MIRNSLRVWIVSLVLFTNMWHRSAIIFMTVINFISPLGMIFPANTSWPVGSVFRAIITWWPFAIRKFFCRDSFLSPVPWLPRASVFCSVWTGISIFLSRFWWMSVCFVINNYSDIINVSCWQILFIVVLKKNKKYCYNADYRTDPKFSDRQVWANSVDLDQTAPRQAVWSGSTLFAIAVWSGSTLFAIQSASFGCIYSMVKPLCLYFSVITANFSGVRIFRVFMVHSKLSDANGTHFCELLIWYRQAPFFILVLLQLQRKLKEIITMFSKT